MPSGIILRTWRRTGKKKREVRDNLTSIRFYTCYLETDEKEEDKEKRRKVDDSFIGALRRQVEETFSYRGILQNVVDGKLL